MRGILSALAASVALAVSAYEFEEEKDIRYSDASPNCILDVKWPKGVTNFATMVFFHGGGLVGDGKSYGPWPQEATGKDPIARVGCRYRVFAKDPERNTTRPEDCLDDAAAATAWVLKNIASYGGDPKKVFVSGTSAGGYQTAMIGMDPKWLAKYGCRTTDLRGIAPYTGQVSKHFNVRAIGFRDKDPTYAPKVDEWAPLYWCKEKAYPPICLVTGGRHDNEMPCRVEENEFLAISLKRCGVRNVEFHETEGSHGGGVAPSAYFVRDFMAKTCDCGMTGRFADGERVVFVGDSITHGGGFVADLQLFQSLRHPGSGAKILNAGISGGTVSQALGRFDNDIMRLNPDRVFVMFGMNDVRRGNWNDLVPNEKDAAARRDALDAYAANQRKLADRFAAAGVKTVLVTPSPFDQYTVREKANSAACNDGLARCADIVRALAAERHLGCVDFHAPLTAIQKANLETVFCPDRVHPQALGHLLMASLVLEEICEPPTVAQVSVDARTGEVWARANKRKKPETRNAVVNAVRKLPNGVAFTYAPKALPLPKTPTYLEADKYRPLTERFNRELFFVEGLPEGAYALAFDGHDVGTFSAAELEKGVNVALLDTPNQRQARAAAETAEALRQLVGRRRREQLVVNMLVAAKVDPADGAKAEAWLGKWLEDRKDSPYVKSFEAWVGSYRELHPASAAFAAEEENLRERLDAVRPAVSRVTVTRK